ncbi:hypothetical protein NPIL_39421 [Nephila pilipes]|uniref:Uncharacterized protein n=1 Tax=Nephila pilipes TaxID=299642 RepID=A0A8X6QS46_NEPPI|nr:hypothetical protein NPIL_39421 [Nephila pilipes]
MHHRFYVRVPFAKGKVPKRNAQGRPEVSFQFEARFSFLSDSKVDCSLAKRPLKQSTGNGVYALTEFATSFYQF